MSKVEAMIKFYENKIYNNRKCYKTRYVIAPLVWMEKALFTFCNYRDAIALSGVAGGEMSAFCNDSFGY
jgi:hypothetical protein